LPSAIASNGGAHTRSALVHGHGRHGGAKARPVPALLMKRKSTETENA
jgi:hypothetical protein